MTDHTMPAKKPNQNADVTKFLEEMKHPMRKEIELLRLCILNDDKDLTENIKWNGPNYCFKNNDRITMRVHPQNQIQLIFHRGAKILNPPAGRLIDDNTGLLEWKGNDRAVITFKNLSEIEQNKSNLIRIVKDWISAATV